MDLRGVGLLIFASALISLLFFSAPVTPSDIVHDDDSAPKKPGCENDFVLVALFFYTCFPILQLALASFLLLMFFVLFFFLRS